jgi:hypothetical protein
LSFSRFSFVHNFISPFAQFYPRFVKLWQDIFFRHGNTSEIKHPAHRLSPIAPYELRLTRYNCQVFSATA